MNYLGFVLFITFAIYATSAEGVVAKNKRIIQPVYGASSYPYNYGRHHEVVSYDYDGYKRYDDPHYNYETYPSVRDLSSHRLHLSGGIFRPYGYDDHINYAGYSPYAYDNKYYDTAASKYRRYPYTYYSGY